jgi:DNA-directed RNA polymerase subunit RPC12/RpoP
MTVMHLRKLKCPPCRSDNLEDLGKDKFRCEFCGVIFEAVKEESGIVTIYVNKAIVNDHHIASGLGDSALIECPYCRREIYLWLRTLEGDPGSISFIVIKGGRKC